MDNPCAFQKIAYAKIQDLTPFHVPSRLSWHGPNLLLSLPRVNFDASFYSSLPQRPHKTSCFKEEVISHSLKAMIHWSRREDLNLRLTDYEWLIVFQRFQ